MQEVFAEAISLVNLPFTLLLGLFMLYWLMVTLGALDGHDGDADFDAHGDFDGDHGFIGGAFHFINLGEAPLMVVLSILALCLWAGSLIANYYYTGHQALLAMAFLLPNLVVSVIVTRYLTLPLRPVFRLLRSNEVEPRSLVGQTGRITTSTASESFGQAEIETAGAPLLITVRTESGVILPRGTPVVIFSEDTERGIYHVTAVPDLKTLGSN